MKEMTATRLGYVAALVAIGGLSLLGSLIVTRMVEHEENVGEVINVAGRQRMLSQRIGLLLSQPNTEGLDEAVSTFSAAHRWLQHAPAGADTATLAPILDGPAGLDAAVTRFLADVSAARSGDEAARERATSAARGPLLLLLERQVQAHTDAAKGAIHRAVLTERGMLALVLLLLVVEALFIFRPLFRQLRTSLARTEAALALTQERERHLRSVLEATTDGFAVLDPAGLLVGEASPRLERWFPNFAADPINALVEEPGARQALRTSLASLSDTPLADVERVLASLPRERRSEAQCWTYEYRLHSHRPMTVLVIVKNVTQQLALERAETTVRESTRDRVTALSRLAAGVAHELATPTAFVLSNLEFALEELRRTASPRDLEVIQALDESLVGSLQLRRIIEDMRQLAVERANSDPLDIAAALQEWASTHAEVITKLEPTPRVAISAGGLTQVIAQLVLSARRGQAADAPTQLTARVDDRGWVVIEVGPPAADGELATIDPLLGVDRGSVLGLTRSHALLQSVGGKLSVRTQDGQARTLVIELPPAEQSTH